MNLIKQLLGVALLGVAVPTPVLAQDAEIWVSFVDNPNRETNGIYGFPANDPQALTARKTAPELYFMKGTGYQDGVIYGMDYKQGFFMTPDRYILYAIDTKTWSVTSRDVSSSLALKEAACGADGTVYALFDDDRLGTIDYKTLTRTDIATPQRSYAALGVTGVGELYGIDRDANLVSINTTTGAETVVGNIGISINGYGRATGEIDPVSGLFYLAAQGGYSGAPSIYAINLQTCTATTVGQLPAGYDYLGGMIIVGEPAAAGAPGRASDLKATFEGNALTGTFAFTAPTETFDHQALEGEMAYTVTYGTDGQQSLSGTVNAGERTELPLTLQEGGNITFTVKMANAAGEGPSATLTQWIGPDAPLSPANVQLAMSQDGEATLTWTAPTACVNGGYLGTLTYNVWRIVSGEETLVAQGISETSFTEQLTISTLQEYSYAVVALNEGTPSDRALSNKVVMGDGFGVPFTEHFGEGNHLEYFTVVNVNNDEDRWGELTWKLHTEMGYWGAGTSYEEMWVQTDGATDDWLITPPLQLQPNHAYILKFRMKAGYAETPEHFEVMMGRTATVADMTTTLLADRAITNTAYKEFTREFTVSEAGSYCIGFHATPNQGSALYLDDIEVRINASQAAPAQVTDLAATADPTGELLATVSFTTPTTTIDGNVLESLTKVEVLRDDELIATIDAPAVGSPQQVVDSNPTNGFHVYTVIAYNGEGNGLRAETAPVYVGVDVPQAPVVVKTVDMVGRVRFEWAESPATGQNGYVVRPDEVTYEVYSTDVATGQKADLIYEGQNRVCEATYEDTEGFDIAKWLIVARNTAGTSREGAAKIATGTPLLLPYRETFAMGHLKTSIWTEQSGVRSWNPSTEDACDTDAGSLMFAPYKDGDQSAYNTPRLTFVGVRQPQLSYYAKLQSGTLSVRVWQPDGSEVEISRLQIGNSQPADWQYATADLTAFKQQPFVVVKFVGTGDAEGARLFVDNVLINDGAYINGIDDIQLSERPSSEGSLQDGVYDLLGRRIRSEKSGDTNNTSHFSPLTSHLKKGIYIINGKKLIK